MIVYLCIQPDYSDLEVKVDHRRTCQKSLSWCQDMFGNKCDFEMFLRNQMVRERHFKDEDWTENKPFETQLIPSHLKTSLHNTDLQNLKGKFKKTHCK